MTATSPIIDEGALKAATGYERRGDVERWLRDNKVPYYRGRKGALFTTARLLESVHLPQAGSPDAANEIEF